MLEPTKAPWIHPGVVLHEPNAPVDNLLAKFAVTLRERGFNVAGFVQRPHYGDAPGPMRLLDLSNGETIKVDQGGPDTTPQSIIAAAHGLRAAMRDDADLVVISRFSAFQSAATEMTAAMEEGIQQGMPVLTSIVDRNVQSWYDFVGNAGTMIAPNTKALWRWWGPERLYRDLALGVANDEVRQIACGPRWLMVEGPAGAGLAYLPRASKDLVARLPNFRRMSLRDLAQLSQSWDPLEMAMGVAAINAHYNRFDLDGHMGNGVHLLGGEDGRVVVVGAFPGLNDVLHNPQVIETEPRPGEFPTVAMDTLLPGCAAAVVASSTVINRNLPRILRLAQGARIALVGPATPMTPRLYHYGVEVLGGLVVRDAAGLGKAIREGARPRDFGPFCQYLHIHHDRTPAAKPCRFRAS